MKLNYLWQSIAAFIVGLMFAIGLAISGMTQPQNVIGFLDPWNWNPSLLFVMAGAVGVHLIGFYVVKKKSTPLLDAKWHVPTRKDFTPRLILGSALFGIGWGIAGFCPGPALASLANFDPQPAIFFGSMIFGMMLFKKTEKFLRLRE